MTVTGLKPRCQPDCTFSRNSVPRICFFAFSSFWRLPTLPRSWAFSIFRISNGISCVCQVPSLWHLLFCLLLLRSLVITWAHLNNEDSAPQLKVSWLVTLILLYSINSHIYRCKGLSHRYPQAIHYSAYHRLIKYLKTYKTLFKF